METRLIRFWVWPLLIECISNVVFLWRTVIARQFMASFFFFKNTNTRHYNLISDISPNNRVLCSKAFWLESLFHEGVQNWPVCFDGAVKQNKILTWLYFTYYWPIGKELQGSLNGQNVSSNDIEYIRYTAHCLAQPEFFNYPRHLIFEKIKKMWKSFMFAENRQKVKS